MSSRRGAGFSGRGAGRIFGRALDGVKQQERQPYRNEENPRAASRTRVQEGPELLRNEPRWQQEDNYSRQRRMPPVPKHSKAEFQNATEQIMERDRMIKSLRREVENLEKHQRESRMSCSDMENRLHEAEEKLKRRDEEVIALQRVVQQQKDGMNNLRPPQQDFSEDNFRTELAKEVTRAKQELSELRTQWEARGKSWVETRKFLEKTFEDSEKSWQQEIGQLREGLAQREQYIYRVEEDQQKQNGVHVDTLALLRGTQAALEEKEQQYAVLKDDCSMKLAEQELKHQAELQKRERRFQEQLAEKDTKAKQELVALQSQWEAKEEAWGKTRVHLEETLQDTEKFWKKENGQLQELLLQKEQHISRVEEERQSQSGVHRETLALLDITQAALKVQEEECARIKDECSMKLAEHEHKRQAELRTKEESFQDELCRNTAKAQQELADLQSQWEAKEEAWGETRRQLEETLLDSEKIWRQKEAAYMEEIQFLHDGFVQLQMLISEKKKKKRGIKTKLRSLFCWRPNDQNHE